MTQKRFMYAIESWLIKNKCKSNKCLYWLSTRTHVIVSLLMFVYCIAAKQFHIVLNSSIFCGECIYLSCYKAECSYEKDYF